MPPEQWAEPITGNWADEEPGATIHRQLVEAIRAAVAEEREACAKECDRVYREFGESVRTTDTPAGHAMMKAAAGAAGQCAARIRKRGE